MARMIHIAVRGGHEVLVECYARSGDLAVTRGIGLPFDAPGEWRITHVPTGIALPYLFRSKTAARTAMRAARKAVDWPRLMKRWADGDRPQRDIRALTRICDDAGGTHWMQTPEQIEVVARLRETVA